MPESSLSESPIRLGLRVDIDTFRGTRLGVPCLLEILRRHDVSASFFFSVGPDNMGRHLWRLMRPAFLLKMLRSRAASLYGWDILLRGTLWPGAPIGRRLAPVIRDTAAAGHEVGLHAWDHYRWQSRLDRMSEAEIRAELRRGYECLTTILGRPPDCSAAAGWRCDARVLALKEEFSFRYNSDCRGNSLFRPALAPGAGTPQVPVTLPTYDELIGRDGINEENYNRRLLDLIRPGRLNVLTVHAEVEGIFCATLFDRFLHEAGKRGIRPTPLGELVGTARDLPIADICQGPIAGRQGAVCRQRSGGPAARSAEIAGT